MSQPFADVAITNTGATPCLLRGYPRLRAWGHRGWADSPAPSVRLGIREHHGIYERVDHGRRRVVLRPGHRAFFSIGTAMAFQGGRHVFTLTRMTVVLPGTHAPKVLPVSLPATRPRAARFPVGLTAVTAHP
jgi:hypothetical protein